MCITYPVKIVDIKDGSAIVEKDSKNIEVKTSLVSDLSVGDWLLIHANLALKKITQKEAEEIKEYYQDL